MIEQIAAGSIGLKLTAAALCAFAFGTSVPELMAGFVLAIAGGSLLVWAVGAR